MSADYALDRPGTCHLVGCPDKGRHPPHGIGCPEDFTPYQQPDPARENSKYQQIKFPVGFTGGGFRSQVVFLDVCNLCGTVVGNRPAHDVFCFSDDGPSPENYR